MKIALSLILAGCVLSAFAVDGKAHKACCCEKPVYTADKVYGNDEALFAAANSMANKAAGVKCHCGSSCGVAKGKAMKSAKKSKHMSHAAK